MKKLILLFIAILFIMTSAISQTKLNKWDIEKIPSIKIEIQTPDFKIKTAEFSEKEQIEKIMTYLLAVEFKSPEGSDINFDEKKYEWRYRIICEGQRDQVYLFKEFAFIGKSTYVVDKAVLKDFKKLVNSL